MSVLCIKEFCGFLTTNSVNATIYKPGNVNMSDILNPPLQQLLGPTLALFFVLKINRLRLWMGTAKLYHSISVFKSVQSKLFLMYLCLVCWIIFSSYFEINHSYVFQKQNVLQTCNKLSCHRDSPLLKDKYGWLSLLHLFLLSSLLSPSFRCTHTVTATT